MTRSFSRACTIGALLALGAGAAHAEDGPAALPTQAPQPTPEAEQAVKAQVTPRAPLGYDPLLQFSFDGIELKVPISMAERVELVSDIPLDADGTSLTTDPAFDAQVRLAANLNTRHKLKPVRLVLDYEHDLLTGLHAGGAADPSLGLDLPYEGKVESQLRKASAQLDLGYHVHFLGGYTTSHWGMGLLANDGAHGWTPGSALFIDPRGGDRVLRGAMILGPLTDSKLALIVGMDDVQLDDQMLQGDDVFQGLAALVYNFGEPTRRAGIYAVSRSQSTPDGKKTNVGVVDIEGQWSGELADGSVNLDLQTEAAFIFGSTTLAPSIEFEEHDVRQFAWAGRAGVNFGSYGFWLDALWASGESNLDDDAQTGFRADPNYPMGLLMHRAVVSAQTSRAPITASDPDLVGLPSPDLDRIPTRGAVTNTVSLFPRAWVRFLDHIELYGGPLVAFADQPPSDPLQTRLGGGTPHGALGGASGSFLGTELDLGLRAWIPLDTAELMIGAEGGYLMPGDAFQDAQGQTMDPVQGARLTARLRL